MCRKKRNREVHLIALRATLKKSFACYPRNKADRNFEQIYKSNNWLKRHGYPKRRKPFVQGWVLEEEYEKILVEMLRKGLPVEKELEEVRNWMKKVNKND